VFLFVVGAPCSDTLLPGTRWSGLCAFSTVSAFFGLPFFFHSRSDPLHPFCFSRRFFQKAMLYFSPSPLNETNQCFFALGNNTFLQLECSRCMCPARVRVERGWKASSQCYREIQDPPFFFISFSFVVPANGSTTLFPPIRRLLHPCGEARKLYQLSSNGFVVTL